jgi:hypothetical protein
LWCHCNICYFWICIHKHPKRCIIHIFWFS